MTKDELESAMEKAGAVFKVQTEGSEATKELLDAMQKAVKALNSLNQSTGRLALTYKEATDLVEAWNKSS